MTPPDVIATRRPGDPLRFFSSAPRVRAAALAAGLALFAFVGACGEEQRIVPPIVTSQPVTEKAPSPAPASAPVEKVAESAPAPFDTNCDPDIADFQVGGAAPLPPDWLVIESPADRMQRAWLEGSLIGNDRIVIDTRNVRQFRLDVGGLRLGWDKRVVLRIDGYNSELTRKRWPALSLRRTDSGAWVAID